MNNDPLHRWEPCSVTDVSTRGSGPTSVNSVDWALSARRGWSSTRTYTQGRIHTSVISVAKVRDTPTYTYTSKCVHVCMCWIRNLQIFVAQGDLLKDVCYTRKKHLYQFYIKEKNISFFSSFHIVKFPSTCHCGYINKIYIIPTLTLMQDSGWSSSFRVTLTITMGYTATSVTTAVRDS